MLRDDLMVVIPRAVVEEGYFRIEKVLTVKELRFLRDEEVPRRNRPKLDAWLATFETDPETVIEVPTASTNTPKDWPNGAQIKIKYLRMDRDRRNCTGVYRIFLDTFETIEPSAFDPLIKVPAGIEVDLGIKGPRYLSALQRMGLDCGTKHGQAWLAKAKALADDIEIVIPEEVLAEGWFSFSDGVAWVQTLRSHAKRVAAWERYPAACAFLRNFVRVAETLPPPCIKR